MAKVQEIVTDRKTVRELVEFMEEAVREGLTKEEITNQVDLMLDEAAQKRLRRSREEVRARKVKHFKNPKDLLDDLHSPD